MLIRILSFELEVTSRSLFLNCPFIGNMSYCKALGLTYEPEWETRC